jgi:TRAP transporter 4TM/12TM fusion protein
LLPNYLGGHGGYDVSRIVTQSFLTMEGIFGVALQVMFTYVFPFILFGVVLELIGALGFAIDLAQAIFGRFRGGPAKVAVVASGMVGMINGSAVANVVTAGSLTIPMMKRIGFPSHVAGAIEAVGSTGGQLMPPVMGAAAFMMAEFLGVPYLTVAKAALLPALLYYLALFATIHFYSVRHDLGGLPQSDTGALVLSIMKRNEMYLFCIPVAVLITLMLSGFTTTRAVSIALATAFVTSMFVKGQRLSPRRLVTVLEKAAKDSIQLCCASACVGIIIGLTLMTALGSRFTSIIIEMSGGNLFFALFLVMVSSIILGLGLPTTICYVLLATLAGPALVQLGIEPIAAHMFILYFGMMSMVTPPSAMAAYAGAAIAGADMMKTGMTATRFALCGFLLPYTFVLNPALLLSGSVPEVLLAILTGSIGVITLGAAVAGHIKTTLKVWERLFLLLAAIALIDPGLVTDLIGLTLLAIVLIKQYRPAAVANPTEVVKS